MTGFLPSRTLLAAALTLAVGCRSHTAGPKVQALVDRYATGLVLGSPLTEDARQRYHLEVEPYLGYRDSGYVAPDGLRNLAVKVDEYVDDGNPHVSPDAKVYEVSLAVPDSGTSNLLQARIRGALGTPAQTCYAVTGGSRWRQLFWSGDHGRGVRLLLARSGRVAAHVTPVVPGSGGVTFGAEPPSMQYVAVEPCT